MWFEIDWIDNVTQFEIRKDRGSKTMKTKQQSDVERLEYYEGLVSRLWSALEILSDRKSYGQNGVMALTKFEHPSDFAKAVLDYEKRSKEVGME